MMLGVALVGMLGSPAAAADSEDELDLWVPSFSVFFSVINQKANGTVRPGTTGDPASGNIQGPPVSTGGCAIAPHPRDGGGPPQNSPSYPTTCPISPPPPESSPNKPQASPLVLVPTTMSRDTSVASMVGASIEVMSPRLVDGWLSPRMFGHVEAQGVFGFNRNLAGERKPGTFEPVVFGGATNDVPELAVRGQGTRSLARTGDLMLSAGIGVAFTTQIFERTIRIKPSLEYVRQQQRLTGKANRAVKIEVDRDASDDNTLDDFRLVQLTSRGKLTQNGLGAGLELEIDSGRLGPFSLSLFFGGRAYRILDNLEETLVSRNEFNETVSYDFDFDPWLYRVDSGLRFRFLPE